MPRRERTFYSIFIDFLCIASRISQAPHITIMELFSATQGKTQEIGYFMLLFHECCCSNKLDVLSMEFGFASNGHLFHTHLIQYFIVPKNFPTIICLANFLK